MSNETKICNVIYLFDNVHFECYTTDKCSYHFQRVAIKLLSTSTDESFAFASV